MAASKSEKAPEVPVVDSVGGVAEVVAAAPEGDVVLRHPNVFGVYQTVHSSQVKSWESQGWLRLK